MGDERKPGVSAAVDHDAARVHPLAHPELDQRLSETVGADGGEKGGVGADARGGDHRVRRIAAEALHERGGVARLLELDQRFSDRQEIGHEGQLAGTATATPAISPAAA